MLVLYYVINYNNCFYIIYKLLYYLGQMVFYSVSTFDVFMLPLKYIFCVLEDIYAES
jgi:hypothetical protein